MISALPFSLTYLAVASSDGLVPVREESDLRTRSDAAHDLGFLKYRAGAPELTVAAALQRPDLRRFWGVVWPVKAHSVRRPRDVPSSFGRPEARRSGSGEETDHTKVSLLGNDAEVTHRFARFRPVRGDDVLTARLIPTYEDSGLA